MLIAAKIYRKNACQEVFGASKILVPMIFGLSKFKTLVFNELNFIGTFFCPYDFWEKRMVLGKKSPITQNMLHKMCNIKYVIKKKDAAFR